MFTTISHKGINCLFICSTYGFVNWGFNNFKCLSIFSLFNYNNCSWIISSGLFCLANISYERLGSRSLLLNKGLLSLMPSMTFWWFLLLSCNIAAPPSLNLMGEVGMFNSTVSWMWTLMFILMVISIFSDAYSLYLYSYNQHGCFYSGLFSSMGIYCREYMLLTLHGFSLYILILSKEIIM